MLALQVVLSITFAMTPAVLYRLSGATFERGAFLRWGIIAGPVLLACQWLALRQFNSEASIAVGVAANVAIFAKSARNAYAFRRLDRWADALSTADGKNAAVLDLIEKQLTKWWGSSQRPEAAISWTLRFAERAIVGGFPDRALRWVDLIPPALLDRKPVMHAAATQYRVSACIRLHDLAGARNVLARTPRPLPVRDFELAMQSMEGLVAVLEGTEIGGGGGGGVDALEARAARAISDATTPAPARLTWQLVQIHALAARHADDEARALIRKIREEQGDEPITRLIRHRGPGSSLAERLVADQPYR